MSVALEENIAIIKQWARTTRSSKNFRRSYLPDRRLLELPAELPS